MDQLELTADLDREPLRDANIDKSVERDAVARQIPQILRCVDADVGAALGTTFMQGDLTSAYGPAVISHSRWQRRFGGDPSIIGRDIHVRGETVRVVGVMPPDFAFPAGNVDLWLAWDFRLGYADLGVIPRTWRFLNVVGRLQPSVSTAMAESDLQSVSARLADIHPTSNNGWSVRLNSLFEETVADARRGLFLGFGAVGFLLLLTCVNVANVLLARFPNRTANSPYAPLSVRADFGSYASC